MSLWFDVLYDVLMMWCYVKSECYFVIRFNVWVFILFLNLFFFFIFFTCLNLILCWSCLSCYWIIFKIQNHKFFSYFIKMKISKWKSSLNLMFEPLKKHCDYAKPKHQCVILLPEAQVGIIIIMFNLYFFRFMFVRL